MGFNSGFKGLIQIVLLKKAQSKRKCFCSSIAIDMKTYVRFDVAGGIHVPQKHFRATHNIWYSIERHAAQQHVQNTLLSFHCNRDKANALQCYVIRTLPNLLYYIAMIDHYN